MKSLFINYATCFIVLCYACTNNTNKISSNYNKTVAFSQKLTKTKWQIKENWQAESTSKATLIFHPDGKFTKYDTFNYLGVKDEFIQRGYWMLNEKKHLLELENQQSGQIDRYEIKPESENFIHLISLDRLEDIILSNQSI